MDADHPIIQGLEKLAARETKWVWPKEKRNAAAIDRWWQELLKRKPHLEKLVTH